MYLTKNIYVYVYYFDTRKRGVGVGKNNQKSTNNE